MSIMTRRYAGQHGAVLFLDAHSCQYIVHLVSVIHSHVYKNAVGSEGPGSALTHNGDRVQHGWKCECGLNITTVNPGHLQQDIQLQHVRVP